MVLTGVIYSINIKKFYVIDEEGGFLLAVVGVEGDLEVGVVYVASLDVLSTVAD